jgi:hypothetical protein
MVTFVLSFGSKWATFVIGSRTRSDDPVNVFVPSRRGARR